MRTWHMPALDRFSHSLAQLAAEPLAQLAAGLGPGSDAGIQLVRWASTALGQLEGASGASPAGAASHAVAPLARGAVIPWEQYGEAADAAQGGFVLLYRMLLALWVAGHVAAGAQVAPAGSVADAAWRQEISGRLVALFGEGARGGEANDLVREQPQLRSLIGEVLGVWGCPAGEVQPAFQAAFLAGRPPQF
jgi:hypothetical protein